MIISQHVGHAHEPFVAEAKVMKSDSFVLQGTCFVVRNTCNMLHFCDHPFPFEKNANELNPPIEIRTKIVVTRTAISFLFPVDGIMI